MKNIVAVLMALLMFVSCAAFAEEVAAENKISTGFKLTMKDAALVITGYEGEDLDVVMPSSINGLEINGILAGAFSGKAITSIVMPETIVKIEDGAFANCADLTSVTINAPMCEVTAEAFNGSNPNMVINLVEGSNVQAMAEEAGISYAFIPGVSSEIIGGADEPTTIVVGEGEPAEDAEIPDEESVEAPVADESEAENDTETPVEEENDPVIGGGLLIPDAQEAPETEDVEEEPAAEDDTETPAEESGSGPVIGGGLLIPNAPVENSPKITEEPEVTEAPAEIPSIGGGLVFPVISNDEESAPEATAEPVPEVTVEPVAQPAEAPAADEPIDTTLRSFHDFSGQMPVAYITSSEENSGYSVTYSCDSKVIADYISIFPANGWILQDAGNDGIMSYTFVMSPDYSSMFYITRMLDGSSVSFVFDTSYSYGFDPVNGL